MWFAVNLVCCRNIETSPQEIYIYPKTLQKGDNTCIEIWNIYKIYCLNTT